MSLYLFLITFIILSAKELSSNDIIRFSTKVLWAAFILLIGTGFILSSKDFNSSDN